MNTIGSIALILRSIFRDDVDFRVTVNPDDHRDFMITSSLKRPLKAEPEGEA